jgi:hypothetical protein
MAFLFASASSQYLIGGSAPVSAVPLTIAAWFRPTASGASGAICAVGGVTDHCRLSLSSGQIQALSFGSASPQSSTSGSITAGQWAHCAAVFSGTASRIAYLNGVAATENTTNCTQGSFSETLIGARRITTLAQFISGDIAEVGVWNAALTADEIAGLAKGFPCRLARPSSLQFYSRLIRNAMDIRGGIALTNTNGATVSDHPRIIYPC